MNGDQLISATVGGSFEVAVEGKVVFSSNQIMQAIKHFNCECEI